MSKASDFYNRSIAANGGVITPSAAPVAPKAPNFLVGMLGGLAEPFRRYNLNQAELSNYNDQASQGIAHQKKAGESQVDFNARINAAPQNYAPKFMGGDDFKNLIGMTNATGPTKTVDKKGKITYAAGSSGVEDFGNKPVMQTEAFRQNLADATKIGLTVAPGLGNTGIKGSAIVGGLYNAADTKDPNDIAKNFAEGAAGGAIAHGAIGFLGKAGSKLTGRGAQEAEQAAANTAGQTSKAQQLFRDLKGAELDVPKGKYDPNPKVTIRELQDNLSNRGLTFDEEGIRGGKKLVGDQMQNIMDNVLSQSGGKSIKPSEIFNNNLAIEMRNLEIGAKVKPGELNDFVRDFVGQEKFRGKSGLLPKDFNVADAINVVQNINKGIRDKGITGIRRQVATVLKGRLDGVIAKEAPEYGPLAKEYAIYSSSENPSALKELSGTRTASTNPATEISSKAYNKIKKGVGVVGDKVLNSGIKVPGLPKGGNVGETLTGLGSWLEKAGLNQHQIYSILGAQAMTHYADSNNNGVDDTQETPQLADAAQPSTAPQDQERDQKRRDIARQLLMRPLNKGEKPMTTKEALAEADGYLEIMGYGAAGGADTPKLSAGQQDKIADARSSLEAISGLRDSLQNNKQVGTGPILGRLGGLNIFDANRAGLQSQLATVSQNVAKALEGGKLTDKDRDYYLQKVLPSLNDTPEEQIKKLDAVEKEIKKKLGQYYSTYSSPSLDTSDTQTIDNPYLQ